MADDKKPKSSKPQSPWGKVSGKGASGAGGSAGGNKPTNTPAGTPGAKPGAKPGADSPWNRPKPTRPRVVEGGKRSNPDLEKFFPGMRARRPAGGGGRGNAPGRPELPKVPGGALAIGAAVLLAFTSVYTVQENEQAAVLRFGDYVRTANSGLNFKLPYPIETKIVEAVTDQKEITVGANSGNESLMVTGDENIVDLQFTVLYFINDLGDYLFEVEDPDELVRATAESVVREVVGREQLDDIITTQRARLIAEVTQSLQELLDQYEAGVQVVDVQFQRTDPPEGEVQEAFDRVVASDQEAEAAINAARAEFNRVTLEAEGQAAALIEEATAYRDRVIAVSEGEAERFRQVYNEYARAPEVTRRRIYLETLEDIYGGANKIILDGEAGAGAVPYLPLDGLNNGGRNTSGGQ